ncbi:MAG TPA: hypothetical protein DHV55_01810 [Clostridiaceae bacterium]|nr:hypothetical protein [Clostridiaceae bacterium]
MTGIAIIELENSYSNNNTQAYVVNADGNMRFRIELPSWTIADGEFYDVYYIDSDLCFFFYAKNEDYRMIIDTENGTIKNIHISK